MPIYEYVCSFCGHRFDARSSFGQETIVCPECDSTAARSHKPVVALIRFQGPGFYTTDQNLAGLPDTLREGQ